MVNYYYTYTIFINNNNATNRSRVTECMKLLYLVIIIIMSLNT